MSEVCFCDDGLIWVPEGLKVCPCPLGDKHRAGLKMDPPKEVSAQKTGREKAVGDNE